MAYSDSLFLALAALGLLAIDRERWLAGWGCGERGLPREGARASRSSPRSPWPRWLRQGEIARYRPLIAVAVAPLGVVGWTLYQWVRVGTPTAYVKAQETGWNNEFVWFTTPFRSLWHVATDRSAWQSPPDLMAGAALVLVVASIVAAVIFARRQPTAVPIAWWVYSGVTILFAFSPFWPTSVLRYAMAAFPLFAVAWGRLSTPSRQSRCSGVGLDHGHARPRGLRQHRKLANRPVRPVANGLRPLGRYGLRQRSPDRPTWVGWATKVGSEALSYLVRPVVAASS